jgi:hypothetical protein
MTTPPFPVPPQQPQPGAPNQTPPAGYPQSGQPPQAAPPAPAKRGNALTSKPVIGIAALVVGLILGAGTAGGGKQAATTAAALPTVTVTATATAEADEEPADEPTAEPSEEPTDTETTPPAPAKKSYKTLSSRTFKLMVKDPDSYIGKSYVIYGEITQFDSATGTDTFRADTGPKKLRISYGYVNYDQNSMLTGTETKLKKLVEGDCFKAKVTVLGSYSYDTQAGGNTTVPSFQVDSISVYGSTD